MSVNFEGIGIERFSRRLSPQQPCIARLAQTAGIVCGLSEKQYKKKGYVCYAAVN